MTFNWIILALVVPLVTAARIQLLDLTPEEAQKLITQQSLDLRYAKKLSEGSASGRSYNGKIIDSDDYTEEIYEANQFHGQDGLGRAIFGYTDNLQSRLEARNANGEVRGQYQYIDPFGEDIQVQYWVDSLGFHQNDNHPRFDLQPVTETPEVKQARKEHERLWKEAARLNGVDPDSNDLYNPNAEKLENDSYDDDEQELEGQVSNQHQSLSRYPVLPYTQHIHPENSRLFGKVDDDSVIVDPTSNINNLRSRFARQQQNEIEEVTSEPRGFFYSFDYPVPFIVGKNAQLKSLPEAQASENFDVRFDDNAESASVHSNEAIRVTRVSEKIRDAIIVQDEVHDVQTSPKQKQQQLNEANSIQKSSEKPAEATNVIPKLANYLVAPKESKIPDDDDETSRADEKNSRPDEKKSRANENTSRPDEMASRTIDENPSRLEKRVGRVEAKIDRTEEKISRSNEKANAANPKAKPTASRNRGSVKFTTRAI